MDIDPTNLLHPLKLTFLSVKEDAYDYHFHVETPEPRCCEACGVIDNWVKFGKDDQSYRDMPIHHKRVTIKTDPCAIVRATDEIEGEVE